jgi:hypothetical protein
MQNHQLPILMQIETTLNLFKFCNILKMYIHTYVYMLALAI